MLSKQRSNVIYVFIDASNLWEAQKAKGKFFDYQKLIAFIEDKFCGEEIKVFYYTAYPAEGTRDYSLDGKHKFFTGDSDFLALITRLRQEDKKVYIFSSRNNVSQELRTGGDGYFDVLEIEKEIWGRELKRRVK